MVDAINCATDVQRHGRRKDCRGLRIRRRGQGLHAEPAGARRHSLGGQGRPQLRPPGGDGWLPRGDNGGGRADRRQLTINQ